jgi:hypothetical protein
MSDNTPISHLRKQILKQAGKYPTPRSKKMVIAAELPDLFPKTHTMKLLEYEHNIPIEKIIFKGSLNEVVRYIRGRVDRSTISKWRKHIIRFMPELEEEDYV